MKTLPTKALIALLFTGSVLAQTEEKVEEPVKKWPTQIIGTKVLGKHTVTESEAGFVYETRSYRVRIPEKIESSLVSNFVISAESVAYALRSIPLPLYTLKSADKALIEISLDEESYLAAGGTKGTAGLFNGRTKKINIQWEHLNRVPAGSQLLRRPAFDLLVHELTHLCMHGSLWKMETWFAEGVAEYLAAAHLVQGHFDFTQIDTQIRDHVRNQTGARGSKVQATSIPTLLSLSSREWLRQIAELPPEAVLQSYTSALILTHFCFHGGSKRREKVKQYLKDLEQIRDYRQKRPTLFTPAEAAEIQKKLQTYWKPKGLQLEFR